MSFHSILDPHPRGGVADEPAAEPAYFRDLNLDQVVGAIVACKTEYRLEPYFHHLLSDADAIAYRQEVMRDIQREAVSACIGSFAHSMRLVRQCQEHAEKFYYERQKQRWVLDAANTYCDAVRGLADGLTGAAPTSRGLRTFRDHLRRTVQSDGFVTLSATAKAIAEELSRIRYTLRINDGSVTVSRFAGEADYSAEVLATFERFKQGAAKEYEFKFSDYLEMNHVEAAIIGFVAKLHPDVFARLQAFCSDHQAFLDPVIARFDREVQFYVGYLEFMSTVLSSNAGSGLSFCYPEISRQDKSVYGRDVFDLAVALKAAREGAPVIVNDFRLDGAERVIVVTGPNQGGKTTFARTFGQLHHLARLGCPVPGTGARLFLFDRLFTHFEREERFVDLRGKLEDDLVRIHGILQRATPASIIIMNEIFTSTSLSDAVALGKATLDRILALDALCVCVTFLDELASLNERTVSMVSTVVPEDPSVRTFKIVRRPADGLAYALSLAEKHRLTLDHLRRRLPS